MVKSPDVKVYPQTCRNIPKAPTIAQLEKYAKSKGEKGRMVLLATKYA